MKKNIGQSIMIGISGFILTSEEKKFIIENNISGVTLFSRNLENPKQIRELCSEIQNLRYQMPDRAPLFIGIDMEGGRVLRLKSPYTPWPAAARLGKLDHPTVCFNFANRMGLELKATGINLNFAPCLDILTNPTNPAIGDRSISSDPEIVAKLGSALVRGYIKAEIISCIKHFPGHGNTKVDSHEHLPTEESSLSQLESRELIPFKRGFKARADMVMTSHILFKNIDPKNPVTFSDLFLKKIIREQCRYKGLIITDDLDMGALTHHYKTDEIPKRALRAGADLLLYCNRPESHQIAIESVIEAVVQGQVDGNYLESQAKKILQFKKEKLIQPDPWPYEEAMKIIGHPDHLKLAASVEKGEIPADLTKITENG